MERMQLSASWTVVVLHGIGASIKCQKKIKEKPFIYKNIVNP
jgi:hypothetical protein